MTEWDQVQLDTVAELSGGYAFKSEEYAPSGRFVLRTLNITEEGRISTHDAVFIPISACGSYDRFALQKHDTLFVMVGATLGKVGYVTERDLPALLNQNMWRIRAQRGAINKKFLHYAFRYVASSGLAGASGSARSFVKRDDYRRLKIPFPPAKHQDAIALLLGSLDDKIDLNRRMNETLEAMARAIFKDWFVDFGPVRAKAEGRQPPGLEPDVAALFPDALDENDKPVGWRTETLASIASRAAESSIRTGPFGSQLHQSDYLPSGVPVVMPTNLKFGGIAEDGIARVSLEVCARLSEHKLEAGDIVYGRRGDIGRKALVGPEQHGWLCGTGCLKVRLRTAECPPLFLFYFLDLATIRDWISARAIGATMPNLNTSIMGEVEVLLPGSEVCSAFCDMVERWFERARLGRLENATLANLRDLLLPKLMSGEIRIRDAERAVEAAA